MHIPLHFANIALRGFYGMALREGVAAAVSNIFGNLRHDEHPEDKA